MLAKLYRGDLNIAQHGEVAAGRAIGRVTRRDQRRGDRRAGIGPRRGRAGAVGRRLAAESVCNCGVQSPVGRRQDRELRRARQFAEGIREIQRFTTDGSANMPDTSDNTA